MVPLCLVLALAVLFFYVSSFRSMCAVPNMAVFCSSLTLWFPGMSLTYFLNDLEMVPVAPIITGIALVFAFRIIIIIIIIIIIMLMPSYYNWLSQDGVVGVGKGLWPGATRNGCSISNVGMRFFSSPKLSDRPCVQISLVFSGYRRLFLHG